MFLLCVWHIPAGSVSLLSRRIRQLCALDCGGTELHQTAERNRRAAGLTATNTAPPWRLHSLPRHHLQKIPQHFRKSTPLQAESSCPFASLALALHSTIFSRPIPRPARYLGRCRVLWSRLQEFVLLFFPRCSVCVHISISVSICLSVSPFDNLLLVNVSDCFRIGAQPPRNPV